MTEKQTDAAQGKDGNAADAAIAKPRDPVIAALASLIQLGLVICAVGMIWQALAMTLTVDTAIQQIYQLMLFSSGLTVIAIVGVWGAVDALRRSISP